MQAGDVVGDGTNFFVGHFDRDQLHRGIGALPVRKAFNCASM